MKKKVTIKLSAGLTLVETLVAITVLLMAVVGPMVIYSNNINNVRDSGNRATAYYLAQEGVELVKHIVWTKLKEGVGDWLTPDLANCIGVSGGCYIDPINISVSPCGGACDPILIDSFGVYNYTSGTPTLFRRSINLDTANASGPDEAILTSTVSWTSSGVNKSITIKEYIYRWR